MEDNRKYSRAPPYVYKRLVAIHPAQNREAYVIFTNRTDEDELFVEFQVERVTQSTRQAVAGYAMHKYPGRILNIVASKRNVAETVTDTRYVWTELGGGGSQTVQVAATDSGRLLTSPHVGEVSGHQAFLAGGAQDEIAGDRRTRDMSV